METLLQDLRYGFRTLVKAPGLIAVIVVSIALALGRYTASLLYGISGTDLVTFIAVPTLLLLVAFMAIVLPAFRAAHVEPTTALRYE